MFSSSWDLQHQVSAIVNDRDWTQARRARIFNKKTGKRSPKIYTKRLTFRQEESVFLNKKTDILARGARIF